jgi:hypothetical protein
MSGSSTLLQRPCATLSTQPIALRDLDVVRGVLGEIKPWSSGLILVCIGRQQVVLPAELEKKLKRFDTGCRIEVLRLDGYMSLRLDA